MFYFPIPYCGLAYINSSPPCFFLILSTPYLNLPTNPTTTALETLSSPPHFHPAANFIRLLSPNSTPCTLELKTSLKHYKSHFNTISIDLFFPYYFIFKGCIRVGIIFFLPNSQNKSSLIITSISFWKEIFRPTSGVNIIKLVVKMS